jgi:uncharacterized protein (TIGR02268 family)
MNVLPAILVFLQAALVEETAGSCEDSQRIELARVPAAAREVCVSPGVMTGFVFDTTLVDVELQDEVRFGDVLHGRNSIVLFPPRDMEPGERLRLTVRLGKESSQQLVAFTLVAHRGQATRQVEVFRDERPRESYQQEVAQEQAKNQRLREENQRLQVQLERSQGLRSLIANKTVGVRGVRTLNLTPDADEPSNGALSFRSVISYRAENTVAAEVTLLNSSAKPWTAVGASLIGAQGEEMAGLKLRQEKAIEPHATDSVIVEADARPNQAQGQWLLKLWDAESRVIAIPGVVFP